MGLPPPVVHVNTRLRARGEREIHTWDISSQPAGTSCVQRRCSRGVCEIGGRFPPADSSSCSIKDRNSLSPQKIFLVLIMFVSYGKAQLFHRLLLVVVSGGGSCRAHSLPPLLNFLFALHWCLEITVQRNTLPPLYCSFIYCRGRGGGKKPLPFLATGRSYPEKCWPGQPSWRQSVWVPAVLRSKQEGGLCGLRAN